MSQRMLNLTSDDVAWVKFKANLGAEVAEKLARMIAVPWDAPR
jgi:hypothetical protein